MSGAAVSAQGAMKDEGHEATGKLLWELEKEWMATLDGRTRHSHAVLDGEHVPNNKKFSNGCRFPGDPQGPAAEVYNCRCTLVVFLPDVDTRTAQRWARDPVMGKSELVAGMNYQQWYAMKEQQHRETAMKTARKKVERESSDKKQYEEYKQVLGKDAPKSFAEFQDLKYNEPEKWEKLKNIKRQAAFVEKAPCDTTEKKFSSYFLKPGAKHAQDFFAVGYTQDNPLQLRYDMARQFDMSKAVDISTDDNGKERFRIYMNLGVSEEKRFRTVWIKDTTDGKPRIITAFREDKGNDT